MSWRRYVAQVRSLPPRVTWRKARRKVRNSLERNVGRLRARLLGTDISDGDFLRALSGRFPTSQVFLDHLTARKEPRFFLDPSRRREFVEAVRDCCPDAETQTIAAADRVCNHIFDLLGSGPVSMGERIDWHVDFKTGHRFTPDKYYADVRPAPYPGGYDIKVPWELSRCQHFAWLGQAYWFTGDEKYAREFIAQVLDWIEQNLPQFGINWACTMDVAIRAINWLWGYHFFKNSPSLTDEFLVSFLKSLLAHGRHIIRNLEKEGDFVNNHYLSDLVGLIYLGILCPEFKESAKWREVGLRELWREMFKQVYPDGVDFEASIAYHRLAVELFLSPVVLCHLNGISVPDKVLARLEKMLEFVMFYTKPDGTVPLIGDNDNGRLHRLKVQEKPEREWIDHRYLLAIGAVLFERCDFAQAAGDQWEEAFWLLGGRTVACQEAFAQKELPPLQLGSRAFADGGLYIMRCDDLYMIVDAGSIGQNGIGGHAHNDTLSFELYAKGRTWIVDPGTYVYTTDYEMRNLFRSTTYHNTVVVDGQEQNRFDNWNLFRLEGDARPRVLRWETTEEYDLFVGEHTGYERLADPAIYRRVVYLDKREGLWILRDVVSSVSGEHYLSLCLHCASSEIELSDHPAPEICLTDHFCNRLAIWPINNLIPNVRVEEHGWVSRSYGLRLLAPIVCYQWIGGVESVLVLCPGDPNGRDTYKRAGRAYARLNELLQ